MCKRKRIEILREAHTSNVVFHFDIRNMGSNLQSYIYWSVSSSKQRCDRACISMEFQVQTPQVGVDEAKSKYWLNLMA